MASPERLFSMVSTSAAADKQSGEDDNAQTLLHKHGIAHFYRIATASIRQRML
jgi:hypothetical protein